jgi:pyruvate dehydrogenase E2 component (dihydrolipoamide acetyltransferase)
MNKAITMPQLGLTMEEGTVGTWAKKPGDEVKKDDVILSISTDKVDMDVEATEDGVFRQILVGEGETVPVGTVLAYVEIAGAESVSVGIDEKLNSTRRGKSTESAPANSGCQLATPSAAPDSILEPNKMTAVIASPRARRRALELGIDIETVKGSGENGRIVEQDLENAAARKAFPAADGDARRRRLIADKMVESINTIPAFSVSVEASADKLVGVYESIRNSGKVNLTYTDLLLKAVAVSLSESSAMNVLWKEGTIQQESGTNLALAVATDRGVVAPVLRDVKNLSLQDLSVQRLELTDRTRQSKLVPGDFDGAVGTLSNLGMYRVDSFTGIISPGQTFLLAVGKLRNRPWADDSSLSIRPTVILNLSVDHRVVDGATAAVFLQRIAELIEAADGFLLNLDKA